MLHLKLVKKKANNEEYHKDQDRNGILNGTDTLKDFLNNGKGKVT